jgi:hypothetical protein
MKPQVPNVLRGFVGTLLTEILPNLSAEYSMGNAAVMCQSLSVIADEFERGAEIRFRENEEMRALFAEAAKIVADKGLAARLLDASTGRDASLLISALDRSNAALASLLIELQVAVEGMTGASARAFESKVWDYLVTAADRRKFTLPSFG